MSRIANVLGSSTVLGLDGGLAVVLYFGLDRSDDGGFLILSSRTHFVGEGWWVVVGGGVGGGWWW